MRTFTHLLSIAGLLVAVCDGEESFEALPPAVFSSGYSASFDTASETNLGVHGDSWTVAWCDDDRQYLMSDDSKNVDSSCVNPINGKGYNTTYAELTSSDPIAPLSGTSTSCMSAFGLENETTTSPASSSSCFATWKANGQICLGNTLVMGVSRHVYPWNGFGNSGNLCYTERQKAFDGSIIKSTDFGVTWTAPPALDADSPTVQFPGSVFGTPSFIGYGKATKDWLPHGDGSQTYLYAISNDGYWTSGNAIYLTRALRTAMLTNRSSWQYLTRVSPPAWGARPAVINSNSSFEDVDASGRPDSWPVFGAATTITSYSAISRGKGSHWGGRSLLVTGTSDAAIRLITGLTANRTYYLTGFARTSAASDVVAIGVSDYGGAELTATTSSTDWARLPLSFVPTGTQANIFCRKQSGTHAAFCDNVQLTARRPPVPILSIPGKLGVTQAQYIPPSNGAPGLYLLPEWYYPNPNNICNSRWAFYVAERPCGPWTKLDIGNDGPDAKEKQWSDCAGRTKGYYNPTVVAKWIGAFNSTNKQRDIWLLYGGDFGSPPAYKLYRQRMVLTYPSTATNLIPNGSFESGVSPWSPGPTSVVVTNNAQNGTSAGRMSTTSDGFVQTVTGLTNGASYQLSGFIKVSNAAEQVRIGLKNYGGAEISYPTSSTTYKQSIINITPTTGQATIYCWKWSGVDFAYCDDLQLTKL